jgi:hypothetical protein
VLPSRKPHRPGRTSTVWQTRHSRSARVRNAALLASHAGRCRACRRCCCYVGGCIVGEPCSVTAANPRRCRASRSGGSAGRPARRTADCRVSGCAPHAARCCCDADRTTRLAVCVPAKPHPYSCAAPVCPHSCAHVLKHFSIRCRGTSALFLYDNSPFCTLIYSLPCHPSIVSMPENALWSQRRLWLQ